MFCAVIARRIPAAPDFGPRHGDIAFAELWALKRAFLDMAAYGVYDLVLLHQAVETLVCRCLSGKMTPDEQQRAIIALEHLGASFGVPLSVQVKEALARSCAAAAPGADDEDDACAGEGPENVNAAQSTAAVETSGNEADDFRGGEEETGECRTGEREVAEVGVAAHAMCADAARRDDVADQERAANGANSEVEKKKKRKNKRDHDGRRSDVEATENAGDEKYSEVDEESRDGERAAVEEGKDEDNAGSDDGTGNWEGVVNGDAVDKEDELAQHGGVGGETAPNTKREPKENVKKDGGQEEEGQERKEKNEVGSKKDETANEDESADGKDKRNAVEANNDGDSSKARQADTEDADTDHKKEPDVNNSKRAGNHRQRQQGEKASDTEDKTDGQNELKKRRSPAFNNYHLEECPPPRRDWPWRLQRKNTTQRVTQRNIYDNGTSNKQQRQREEVYRDYSLPASSVGVVLHRALAVLLSRMNVVVILSESD
ncbi:protein starmaker-like [Rhipicephalus sanguineus]|uniref:protein starmaker-like n=1 Tax=Rhipicephalus sanguineus TaxID=34632 RepID=UPI001894B3EC|nr:protein starmaker-like [Rhipicephalus sanguineus]